MNPVTLIVFDLVALALGIALLRGPVRRDREAGLGLALTALLVGASYGIGKLDTSDFAIIRLLCHTLFCVLAPLMLWRGWRWGGRAGLSLIALALVMEGCYLWARRVEPYRLEVTHYRIESERLAGRTTPLRVGVLADLQSEGLGRFEERVFEALASEKPDLVLVPGDLLQLGPRRPEQEVQQQRARLIELFRKLDPPPRLGMWLVQGDCDPEGDTFPGTGLQRLDDGAVELVEERLQLIGLSLGTARRRVTPELFEKMRAFDGLTLLFGHAPEFAPRAAEAGFPFVAVAGHTHGGQVRIPFFGPPLTLSRIPREMAAGGLFPLGNSWLCLSRGIGMERHHAPRIRFLCRPQLVVLELAPPPLPGEE